MVEPELVIAAHAPIVATPDSVYYGDHCFASARPTLWNSLPEQLRQPDNIFGQFRQSLKTFMFG